MSVTLRAGLIGAVLLIVIFASVIFFSRKSKPLRSTFAEPIYGQRDELFSWIRACLRSLKETSRMVTEGYYLYSLSNTPFIIPSLDQGQVVVLPQQQIKRVYGLPESVLDVHNVQNESMQMHYTFPDPFLHEEPLHINVVRNQLTKNIPNITVALADEIEFGFERGWGRSETWREVSAWHSTIRIMAGAGNSAFCGQPLCRNIKFLDRLQQHAMAIFGGAIGLSCLPKPLQPVFGPILTLVTTVMALRVTVLSRPVVEDRLRRTQKKTADLNDDWSPPSDALQWMIDECYASPNAEQQLEVGRVCNRLLLVNDVSLLTTSYTAHNVLLDLLSTDPALGYVETLRQECETVLGEAGGTWNAEAVRRLVLVDSAIRESMRISPFGSLLLPRRVVHEDGIVLEGWSRKLQLGQRIAIPVEPIHMDENNYPDAHQYNPFRFSQPSKDGHRKTAVTLDDHFLSFGAAGRNACPGRFFAQVELKIFIANALLCYDMEPLGKRPPPVQMLWMRYPSEATIRIRRKPQKVPYYR